MSFQSQYNREQWNEIGGFAGVPEYVDSVELLFHDDYDEDEDTEEERTEEIWPEYQVRKITHSAMRPYRLYEREDEDSKRWWLLETGKRLISNDILIGLSDAGEALTRAQGVQG